MAAKLEIGFPLLSDPGGTKILRVLGLWNLSRNEPKPASVVLSPSGEMVLRHLGRDDADRLDPAALLSSASAWVDTVGGAR